MSSKTLKLLERMRHSKAGWKPHDVKALYEGFGFTIKTGGRDDMAVHPDFPQLVGYIPRHTKLAVYVVAHAVKTIDQLRMLEQIKNSEKQGDAGHEGSKGEYKHGK